MLHSFVAPAIILAASVWIDSNRFFESEEQLSNTVSLYSIRGRMYDIYIFSSNFLLTLNLRALLRIRIRSNSNDECSVKCVSSDINCLRLYSDINSLILSGSRCLILG